MADPCRAGQGALDPAQISAILLPVMGSSSGDAGGTHWQCHLAALPDPVLCLVPPVPPAPQNAAP